MLAITEVVGGEQQLLLTCEQVCAILACSRTTLWREEVRGAIRGIRLGRRTVRYTRDEVGRYVAARSAERTE